MAELKDKIENALNEARTVFLGVEILLAFDYQGVFQQGFESLSPLTQMMKVAGLGMLLIATALLLAPATFHQIVERGEDTQRLNDFTTGMVGSSLVFFAADLAVNLYTAGEKINGFPISALIGLVGLVLSLFFWYGLEAVVRGRRHPKSEEEKYMSDAKQEKTPLTQRIKQALTETRVVLPGIQALLGFQFAAVVASGFEKLPQGLKQIHLASLGLIAISTVLLMSPAAYHRIVDDGEDTEEMHRYTARMIVAAMVFLALGIAGDFYVVVDKVIGSNSLALGSALMVVILFFGLWFGLMLILRMRRRSSRRPAETRLDQ